MENTNEKQKKYKQIELMPVQRGGKRENAGRKKLDENQKKPKTVAIRIDERLLPEIEKLKKGEKIENLKKENKKEDILKRIDNIKKLRDEAEYLEGKRKSDDQGQFEKIIDMDILLIELRKIVETL